MKPSYSTTLMIHHNEITRESCVDYLGRNSNNHERYGVIIALRYSPGI